MYSRVVLICYNFFVMLFFKVLPPKVVLFVLKTHGKNSQTNMFIFGGSSKASNFKMGGSLASMQTRLVLPSSSASTEYSLAGII